MATPAKARRVEIRVSEEERSLEEAAAAELGQTLSEFIRQAARLRAEEVLSERTSLALEGIEAKRFLDALEHPERFEQGLRRLADRPRVIPR